MSIFNSNWYLPETISKIMVFLRTKVVFFRISVSCYFYESDRVIPFCNRKDL